MRRIERGFNKRIARRSIARFATPIALLAFLLVLFAVQALAAQPGSGPVWLLPMLASLLTYDIMRHLAQRRMTVARDAAPIRNRPSVTLRFGPTGIDAEGARVSWFEIIEVMRLDDATLLLTLPYQALVVPDEALPEGVTPEALLAHISDWKAA